jgi:hypothetical protein
MAGGVQKDIEESSERTAAHQREIDTAADNPARTRACGDGDSGLQADLILTLEFRMQQYMPWRGSMKIKSLLLASILCLGGSAFLSARTRTFTISKAVLIGNYSVPPGTYQLRMHEGTAEITDLNHFMDKKPVKISAKESVGDEKFDHTVVRTEGADYKVTEIGFSHTRDVVQFQ